MISILILLFFSFSFAALPEPDIVLAKTFDHEIARLTFFPANDTFAYVITTGGQLFHSK